MSAQIPLLSPAITPRTSLPLLTGSEMKTWRVCQRLHKHRYKDLYRPLYETEQVKFGHLMHAAEEDWWLTAKAHPLGTPGAAELWLAAAIYAIHATEEDPFRRARAEALMLGYHYRWQDMTWDGEELEVLAVEAEFRAPLINPETGWASKTYDRGGKIDALVRGRSTGKVWVVEHKTTGEDFRAGTPYRDKLVLDAQISHYMVGTRALGYEPAGCIYDVLRRPEQKPKKGLATEAVKWTKETKNQPSRPYAGQQLTDETVDEFRERIGCDIADNLEDYYARIHVVRIGDEEKRSAANDWELALMMRHAERLELYPQNPEACGRWGSRCSFLGVCKGTEMLEDETKFRKAERPHEELSAPASEAPAAA